jgi:hypothetical protein
MNEEGNKIFEIPSAAPARATIGVKDLRDTRFVVEAKGVAVVSGQGALHGGHVRYKGVQIICEAKVMFHSTSATLRYNRSSSYSNTLLSTLPTLPRSLGTNVASYASISSLSPPKLRSAVPGRT